MERFYQNPTKFNLKTKQLGIVLVWYKQFSAFVLGVVVVLVVATFRIVKSVVTGQAPVTLELRNTPGKNTNNPRVYACHPYQGADSYSCPPSCASHGIGIHLPQRVSTDSSPVVVYLLAVLELTMTAFAFLRSTTLLQRGDCDRFFAINDAFSASKSVSQNMGGTFLSNIFTLERNLFENKNNLE